jgi:hypothetical protein
MPMNQNKYNRLKDVLRSNDKIKHLLVDFLEACVGMSLSKNSVDAEKLARTLENINENFPELQNELIELILDEKLDELRDHVNKIRSYEPNDTHHPDPFIRRDRFFRNFP